MKQFIAVFAMALLLRSTTFSQEIPKPHGTAGQKAIVATFHGLSDLGVSNFNGGFGLRVYLLNSLSLRGTVGGSVVAGNGENDRSIGASGAFLADIWGGAHSNFYAGPELFYSHAGTQDDAYTYGFILGGEYYPPFLESVSVAFEYPLTITSNPSAGSTTYSFGRTSGELILHLWL